VRPAAPTATSSAPGRSSSAIKHAVYNVAGAGADEFEGTLELGYQIGFPWSLGVGINLSYTTPNILLDDVNLFGLNPFGSVITLEPVPGCVDQR